LRECLSAYIDQYIPATEERSIAKALVLGDVNEIPAYLRNSYAGTGTIHILSVSGLHIGALFLFLNLCLGFLNRSRSGRLIRIILLCSILWFYAFLTGFSAPVARSVVMFSFMIIGINLRRTQSVYNSLCVAALVLLLSDPQLLFQLGFQLSFIALFGIVWIQPWLASPLKPKRWIWKWLWTAFTGCIAAQIATLPLCLFYFKQFPLYFIISNLIIVPLSTVALGAGVLFLLVCVFPFPNTAAVFSGKIVYWIIHIMNEVAAQIGSWPFALPQGFFLTPLLCIILALSLGLLILALQKKNRSLLKTGLAASLLFFGLRSLLIWQAARHPQLVLYSIPQTFAMSVTDGSRLSLMADSSFLANEDLQKYHLNNYLFSRYFSRRDIRPAVTGTKIEAAHFSFDKGRGRFYGRHFLILDTSFHAKEIRLNKKDSFDFIILKDNPSLKMSLLQKNFIFSELIFAANNSRYRVEKWKKECKALKLPFHDLREGYYSIER
jgi:competence protein ComEC